MLDVYCIPGMGVDERLFGNLDLNNCIIHHIKWKTPFKDESLQKYAMRLAEQIDTSKAFVLIGVSFGGMCCTEIAKQLSPVKTFIISSNKLSSEIPLKMKIGSLIPFYTLLGDPICIKFALLARKQFGVKSGEQLTLFNAMLNNSPVGYFRGAVQCIIEWKNKVKPPNLIHIHGDNDQILPLKKIKDCDYVIKGGTHFMIMNNAEEINKIINNEFKRCR